MIQPHQVADAPSPLTPPAALSPAMRQLLAQLYRSGPWTGRGSGRAHSSTLRALRRRGLIDTNGRLTAAGVATIAAAGEGDSTAERHEQPAARVLGELRAVLTHPAGSGHEVVWRLAEAARQLDANVLNLPGGGGVATHTEIDLDVLLLVLSGAGALTGPTGTLALTPGALVWLPRGATRALTAGEHGLAYLTVHLRRPGLTTRSRPRTAYPAAT